MPSITKTQIIEFMRKRRFIYCKRYNCKLLNSECKQYQLDYYDSLRCKGCFRNKVIILTPKIFGETHIDRIEKIKVIHNIAWLKRARALGFKSEKEMFEKFRIEWRWSERMIADIWGLQSHHIHYRLIKCKVKKGKNETYLYR